MKHQSDLWFLYDFNYQQLRIKAKNDFYVFNTAKFNCSPNKAIKIVDTYLDLDNNKRKDVINTLKKYVDEHYVSEFPPDFILKVFRGETI